MKKPETTPSAPAEKRYHLVNANRLLHGKTKSYAFDLYGHAGTWFGVFATSDPVEQAELAGIAKTDRALTEIDEAQYLACEAQKKTTLLSAQLGKRLNNPLPSNPNPAPPAEKKSASPEPAPAIPVTPLADLKSALRVESVARGKED